MIVSLFRQSVTSLARQLAHTEGVDLLGVIDEFAYDAQMAFFGHVDRSVHRRLDIMLDHLGILNDMPIAASFMVVHYVI